uniref:Uncharacterized protein n=1 Tax=Oryza barthii TaxID=65489 RepID=A0A0D3FIK0_9ORYZ
MERSGREQGKRRRKRVDWGGLALEAESPLGDGDAKRVVVGVTDVVDLVQWMNLEFGVVQAELSRFASARLSSPSSSVAVGDLATDAGWWLPPPPRAAVATEEPSPIMSDGGGAIRYF